MITTDSLDYHVLANAVKQTAHLDGLICEIGTRAGGSLKCIIDASLNLPNMRPIVSVDPYGWLDYAEGEKLVKHDYTNAMRDTCLKDIFGYLSSFAAPPNVVFFILEDTEFFSHFADSVPVYANGVKHVHSKYSLAFLDGPHSVEAVKREIDFFHPRMQPEGVIVCDDIGMYDHDSVEQHLFGLGFALIERTERKASYILTALL